MLDRNEGRVLLITGAGRGMGTGAIDTSAVLPDDCAFLQQSGMLVIGQEPSPSCAPTPTAPPSMAASKMNDVSHFLIIE